MSHRPFSFALLSYFLCFTFQSSYVTPWHGAGYDFARTFRSKLTYVSPVWYQLRNGGDGDGPSFLLAGGHDFDEAWVSDVRNGIGGGVGTRSGDPGVTKVCVHMCCFVCVCVCVSACACLGCVGVYVWGTCLRSSPVIPPPPIEARDNHNFIGVPVVQAIFPSMLRRVFNYFYSTGTTAVYQPTDCTQPNWVSSCV